MIQKTPYFLGLDLNVDSPSRTVTAVPAAESIDASRPARFFAVDAAPSADDFPPLRSSLCRGAQGQELLVSRPVPVHGLRAADLPGESARYRVEPASPSGEALSSGDSRQRLAQHAGQRQRDPRLAYLRELRRATYRHRARLVCRGSLRLSVSTNLCNSTSKPPPISTNRCTWSGRRGQKQLLPTHPAGVPVGLWPMLHSGHKP